MDDKIIVRIMGGLGNQMFQYAWGRFLADRLNVPLELDLTTFDEGYEARSFALDYFNITTKLASREDVALLRKRPFWGVKAFRKLLGVRTGHVRENGNHAIDEGLFSVKPPALLDGYWQCARYMELARSLINKDFQFMRALSSSNEEHLECINASESVALHVRRGDYVSNPTFNAVHGVCSIDYYRKAVALMLDLLKDSRFYVFSDDLSWVSENLDLPQGTVFIDNNQNVPHEDLRLMTACKHNVIANSSFSWWGAFLGQYSDKQVIAPLQWYAQGRSSGDFLPSSWLKL